MKAMMNVSILALIITLVPKVISSRSEAFSTRVSNSDHETVDKRTQGHQGNPFDHTLQCHDKDDGEATFFHAFKNGLTKCWQECCKDVIIVGGGVTGLTAGLMLKKAGHKVKILEASSRIGGRVQTYRDFSGGWQAELGAMRIPKQHQFTLEVAKRYNLTLKPFNNNPHRYHVFGKQLDKKKKDANSLNFFLDEFNVMDKKDRKAAFDIVQKALKEPLEDFKKMSWNDYLKKYDQYTFKQWLAEFGSVSSEAIDYVGVFYNLEAFMYDALVEIIVDECVHEDPQFQYVLHGMDLIPRSMAEALKDDIQLNAKVYNISQDSEKVSVTFDCKGVACPQDFDNVVQGDNVIMATAAGPSLSIEFDPPLSNEKFHALRNTKYSSSNKVILVFEKPFWEHNGNGKEVGGSSMTDLPVRQIYYEMNKSKSGVGVVLASYTWGRDAQRHVGMTDEDLIDECIKSLAKVHNMDYDTVRNMYLKGVVKKWDLDEFTLGAFTVFEPYQFSEIEPDLKSKEGRIHFGGEHTMAPHGWIDTAMKSGARTAWEIHTGRCGMKIKL